MKLFPSLVSPCRIGLKALTFPKHSVACLPSGQTNGQNITILHTDTTRMHVIGAELTLSSSLLPQSCWLGGTPRPPPTLSSIAQCTRLPQPCWDICIWRKKISTWVLSVCKQVHFYALSNAAVSMSSRLSYWPIVHVEPLASCIHHYYPQALVQSMHRMIKSFHLSCQFENLEEYPSYIDSKSFSWETKSILWDLSII